MEDRQAAYSLNQQLNQCVGKMQSQVGLSGKTLYQILSEYLKLKAEHPKFSQEMEDLSFSEADQIAPGQMNDHLEALRRYQSLRDRVLIGLSYSSEHPWYTFAHPDHTPEEIETLLRTIRFFYIQLSKFWIEIQSLPLFLNTLDEVSLQEIEHLFQWIKLSPTWEQILKLPKIIPALTLPQSRKCVFDFVRNVKAARTLCEKASANQSPDYLTTNSIEKGHSFLVEACEIVQKLHLDSLNRNSLEQKILEARKQREDIRSVRIFSSKFSDQIGLPQIKQIREIRQVFQLKDIVDKIPKKIIPWRLPQIISPTQLIRIKALQDRARPILDAKKKIESHFKLSACTESDLLRKTALDLTSGGSFRSFKSDYKDALTFYQTLLQPEVSEKIRTKDTDLQRAEKLIEWATYLDQAQQFEKNEDISKTFGALFKGIHTDFAAAIEANSWANQLRSDLTEDLYPFSEVLIDFLFKASDENLKTCLLLLNSAEKQKIEEILDTLDLGSMEISEAESKLEQNLRDLSRLFSILSELKLNPDLMLSGLVDLKQSNEEVMFLISQISSNGDLKNLLKGCYDGLETDLSVIEDCISYVKYIEQAAVPESLKKSLLMLQGPQRLEEHRTLCGTALGSLASLKELFLKLEMVTHGQSHKMTQVPVPKLLTIIQAALRQPTLFNDWISYLRSEREIRSFELGFVLDFFESKGIQAKSLVIAYQLAFNASLLKKVIERNLESNQRNLNMKDIIALIH
jgi:hypothetical protein